RLALQPNGQGSVARSGTSWSQAAIEQCPGDGDEPLPGPGASCSVCTPGLDRVGDLGLPAAPPQRVSAVVPHPLVAVRHRDRGRPLVLPADAAGAGADEQSRPDPLSRGLSDPLFASCDLPGCLAAASDVGRNSYLHRQPGRLRVALPASRRDSGLKPPPTAKWPLRLQQSPDRLTPWSDPDHHIYSAAGHRMRIRPFRLPAVFRACSHHPNGWRCARKASQARRRTLTLAIPRRRRQRSLRRFSQQPGGTGLVSPISASLVVRRHTVCVAPRSWNAEKPAPVATVRVVRAGPRFIPQSAGAVRRYAWRVALLLALALPTLPQAAPDNLLIQGGTHIVLLN